LGTIGWILAGLSISYFSLGPPEGVTQGLLKNTFLLSGIAALVLGLFSFIFKTPPTIVSNENQELVDYFVL
jgi:hypothetical protein